MLYIQSDSTVTSLVLNHQQYSLKGVPKYPCICIIITARVGHAVYYLTNSTTRFINFIHLDSFHEYLLIFREPHHAMTSHSSSRLWRTIWLFECNVLVIARGAPWSSRSSLAALHAKLGRARGGLCATFSLHWAPPTMEHCYHATLKDCRLRLQAKMSVYTNIIQYMNISDYKLYPMHDVCLFHFICLHYCPLMDSTVTHLDLDAWPSTVWRHCMIYSI